MSNSKNVPPISRTLLNTLKGRISGSYDIKNAASNTQGILLQTNQQGILSNSPVKQRSDGGSQDINSAYIDGPLKDTSEQQRIFGAPGRNTGTGGDHINRPVSNVQVYQPKTLSSSLGKEILSANILSNQQEALLNSHVREVGSNGIKSAVSNLSPMSEQQRILNSPGRETSARGSGIKSTVSNISPMSEQQRILNSPGREISARGNGIKSAVSNISPMSEQQRILNSPGRETSARVDEPVGNTRTFNEKEVGAGGDYAINSPGGVLADNFSLPFSNSHSADVFKTSEWFRLLLSYTQQFDRTEPVITVVADKTFLDGLLNWLISVLVLQKPPPKNVLVVTSTDKVCFLITSQKIPVPCMHLAVGSLLNEAGKGKVKGHHFNHLLVMRMCVMRILNSMC